MAQSLDVKSRDVRDELDADDPLLELTRIMGIAPRREVESKPADPQLTIEDDFSLDLEQELELDQDADVELSADDVAMDSDLEQSFDEEFSRTMKFGDETPPVVPTLEDELQALLADEPAQDADVEQGSAEELDLRADDMSEVEPEWDLEPEADELEIEEPEVQEVEAEELELEAPNAVAMEAAAPEVDHADADELEMDLAFDAMDDDQPVTEPEPWLEPDLDALMDGADDAQEVDVQGDADDIADESAVLGKADEEDPILSQMNRVFGRSNWTPLQPSTPEPEVDEYADDYSDDFDQAVVKAEATEPAEDHLAEMADFDFDDEVEEDAAQVSVVEAVEPEWAEAPIEAKVAPSFGTDLGRLVGKTELEPVVEAAEFDSGEIVQTDELDIPDFDLASDSAPTMSPDINLDDEYQGYEPPVAKAAAKPVDPEVMEDFALDMPQADDDADIDFEAMLNDELTASVDTADSRDAYIAGAAATVAGAAGYRMQNHNYREELPDPEGLPDDVDVPIGYEEKAPRKYGWLYAAVGALAIIGGGYYAMSGPSTGTSGTAPVLVKADPEPVKVAPETPGGKTVANQDQAVYDKVGTETAALPTQGQLVSEAEEPVDIASVATSEPAADPNAKSEERVDPALEAEITSGQAADTLAVSPKKVRTVVVKPDGTLVERPAEPAAAVPADAATATPVPTPAPEAPAATAEAPAAPADAPAAKVETPVQETAAVTPEPALAPEANTVEDVAKAAEPVVEAPVAEEAPKAEAAPKAAAPAVKVVKTKKIKAPVEETASLDADPKSNAAPILESRPADQPVNIVGKTGNADAAAETQVAAADATPAPTGSYSVQIASTPSPEAAKSTYVALTRKYGSVLVGRGVNVQKAEVAGKGTVYRVRIPAGSKQDAAALCKEYKAAGGNCFVTK